MPTMSASTSSASSSPAATPDISIERITGSIYEIDVDEPTLSLADGTPDAPEGAHGLLFPLHCHAPVLQGEYVCATLRNNTGQKVSLCVSVQGTLIQEGHTERVIPFGLGMVECAPGETVRVGRKVIASCTHYLPTKLLVTWRPA